jgi:hypothetical protein
MKFTRPIARVRNGLAYGLILGHGALVAVSIILAALTIGAAERELAPDSGLSAVEVAALALHSR